MSRKLTCPICLVLLLSVVLASVASAAEVTPHVLDHGGPSYLMARGTFAAEAEPFTLPRSART